MHVLIVDLDNTLNNAWCRIYRCTKRGQDPYESSMFYRDLPKGWAVAALKAFRKQDWKILILTARLSIKDSEDITKRWLDKNKFVYDKVYFVQHLEDKIDFLKKNFCDLFIDDFMSGQENKIPNFRTDVYKVICALGVNVEVFRNNWLEICYRHLGIWL